MKRQMKNAIENNKPHLLVTHLLGAAPVGGGDSLEVGAEALTCPDNVVRLQFFSCRNDACLERLQVGLRSRLALLL